MDFNITSLLFTSLASLALGIFVYLKGRDKLPNIMLMLFSVSMTWWCLGQFMGAILSVKSLVLFWTRFGIIGAVFIPVFFLHFILALIEREQQEKKLLYFVYGVGLVLLALDFTPLFVADVAPVLGFKFYPQAGIVYPYFALFVLLCFVYAFFRLFSAFRSASGDKRNQLLYVLLASLIGFSGGVTAFFPIWGIDFPVLSHYSLPLYMVVTVYAILKHRLFDITVFIREGLIYSTLTLLFAGFYVMAVLITNYYFSSLIRVNPLLTMFLVVFASVLIFQPLRAWVQQIIDRIFFRGEYRYQKTIDDLSLENKKLFQSLLQADKLAALGTLSAGMAHEIKNPLTAIKGMTQILKENLHDPEFVDNYQNVVLRQTDRINNLVEKLLKFGHPQKLTVSCYSLANVINDVLHLLENQCEKKNIILEKKISELPGIEGDAEQISQVILNLCLNAIQAMPDGGRLSIIADQGKANGVQLEVSDTGSGIPADRLRRIFDPFYSTKVDGIGMGLAVAYRIVKEHQGDIQVKSEVGKGTRFSIWLPIKLKV